MADVIDYRIIGDDMQAVIVTLDPEEAVTAEAGTMLFKTALFGGEGLFFAHLTGPGTVYLQTLPFSRMADRITASAPRSGGHQKGEGSVLGGLFQGD